MRRWLYPASYHVLALIVLIALCSIVFAWNSYGLVTLAMANIGFLREHGLMAVVEGGLIQLLLISLKGLISLLSYLGFKGIETELIQRWRLQGRR